MSYHPHLHFQKPPLHNNKQHWALTTTPMNHCHHSQGQGHTPSRSSWFWPILYSLVLRFLPYLWHADFTSTDLCLITVYWVWLSICIYLLVLINIFVFIEYFQNPVSFLHHALFLNHMSTITPWNIPNNSCPVRSHHSTVCRTLWVSWRKPAHTRRRFLIVLKIFFGLIF